METARLHLDVFSCQAEEIAGLIPMLFRGEAWFMLEKPDRYLAGSIADLPADWAKPRFGNLTVFSKDCELMVEPDGRGTCCRLCTEGEAAPQGLPVGAQGLFNGEALVRRTPYLISAHKAAEAFLLQAEAMEHSEYFSTDEDGMPQLIAGRMSGLAKQCAGGN